MSHRVRFVGSRSSCLRQQASSTTRRAMENRFASSCRGLHGSLAEDRSARIVEVADLAERMRASVRSYMESCSHRVKLLGILAHEGPFRSDAELYSELISQTCQEDGIDYELCRVLGDQPSDVEEAIRDGNARTDVHGILVYYPIFKKRYLSEPRGPYKNQLTGVYYKTHDDYLRDIVCPTKDVEGLCHQYNARWLFRERGMQRNNDRILHPCTALSVYKVLEAYHPTSERDPWLRIVVTIVNRSEIMGRPLAAMLANTGATVYSIDAHSILLFRDGGRIRRCTDITLTMEECLRQSTIVVSGVPSPDFSIPCDWINPGTTFVNVSEYSNVCEDSILDIPGVQYVPRVGKVTIAALEQNLIDLHRWYSLQ